MINGVVIVTITDELLEVFNMVWGCIWVQFNGDFAGLLNTVLIGPLHFKNDFIPRSRRVRNESCACEKKK